MGNASKVLIHFSDSIGWHKPFAEKMRAGLKAIGIDAEFTSSRVRESDKAILLGTTLYRDVEATGDYLLVDRCSYFDTNEWVSLVWNGHGRRGDHKVPENRKPRRMPELKPWRAGTKRVLCGQTETYSPHYLRLSDWYKTVRATHFRDHPMGENPTGLPTCRTWDDVEAAITLNSSIGVEAVINGVPTVTMDEGAMAWDVTSHDPNMTHFGNRKPWLEWLSWTQWHHDEIAAGEPIKHLFEEL